MATIHDGKAQVNGVLYHYLLAKGRGDPVVLLHGWASTSYMWRFVMPQLVARGHTVLAPDLRGLGDTAKPATGYDKATVAGDIRALVAKLGLGTRVKIVGHDPHAPGILGFTRVRDLPEMLIGVAIATGQKTTLGRRKRRSSC